jgi:large subunit ribosomal protein L15e
MGATKYIAKTMQKEHKGVRDEYYDYAAIMRERLLEFRKEERAIVRVDRPTNLARARTLGYKAKRGIFVVRVRVRKGSGRHSRVSKRRRPKRMGVNKLTRGISIQAIAEQRASRKYPNCEVLNSYLVAEDGKHKYFEVIMVDRASPDVKSDKDLSWITEKQHRGRAERGLTSAMKKSRGLRRKGRGAEKIRPSLRAHDRKAK